MFTKRELCNAIKECESAPASFQNCEKSAVFYSLYDRLFAEKPESERRNVKNEVQTTANSDFLRTIAGKDWTSLLVILNELMDAIKILQPRLYDAVMQKLQE